MSAHPRAVRHHVESYGYHVQCAAATRAIRAIFPSLRVVEYEWIFAEKAPPNVVSISQPDPTMLAIGARLWQRAVDIFAGCQSTGKWPGYGRIGEVSPSPWAAEAEQGTQLAEDALERAF